MKQTAKESLKALILELDTKRNQFIETDLKMAVKGIDKKGYYEMFIDTDYVFLSIVNNKAVVFNKKQTAATQSREAIAYLQSIINPGDTVKTILRHCSRSGMARNISLVHNGVDISYYAAKAMDYTRADDGGLKTGGCGMDMGFSLVYNLSSTLFPKGFTLSKGQYGRNGDKSGFDTDGGYAIRHEWL